MHFFLHTSACYPPPLRPPPPPSAHQILDFSLPACHRYACAPFLATPLSTPPFLAPRARRWQGKRGRMSEKAEDDILMKRAETEAAGKAVYSV